MFFLSTFELLNLEPRNMERAARAAAFLLLLVTGCGGGGGGGGKEGASVTCAQHSSRVCYVGSAYWYDSCGNREDLAEACGADETCSGGRCVTLWEKTYGGSGADRAAAAQPTADGGYVAAGYTQSYGAGSSDFWIVKTDSAGNQAWAKTFGGADRDEAKDIQQTADGGYIVAGYTRSYGAGDADFWVMKLDASGAQTWRKTLGGANADEANSVRETADGGYFVAGFTRSYGAGGADFWILKLDSSGNKAWEKTVGGETDEVAESARQTADGGYIVAGRSESPGTNIGSFYIVKIDSTGALAWEKTFGGDNKDGAADIQQTSDGGYIAAGYTFSYGAGADDFWVVKMDSSGNEEWNTAVGGAGSDEAHSIIQTDDGGYIVAGETASYGAGSTDAWVVKLTASGKIEWTRAYGGMNSDWADTIQQTPDGGYAHAGSTFSQGAGNYDFWLMKIGPDGLSESCPYGCCRSSDCGGGLPRCLDAASPRARCVECASNSDCRSGICKNNSCTLCSEKAYRECANGNVYWFDSCGRQGSVYEQCKASETCSGGMCVPAENEQKGYFGGDHFDTGQSVGITSDEGFIVTGITMSFDVVGTDVYVVKADRRGSMKWENHFGGAGDDSGAFAAETNDGGYIVAGQTNSFGAGGYDAWLIKLDPEGDEAWEKLWGGANSEVPRWVAQTPDGGFAVAGFTQSFGAGGSDFFLLKTDLSGEVEWSKTFGGPGSDTLASARRTSDGGYVMVGQTYSYGAGSADGWVVKADSSGNAEWTKTFGGAGYDELKAVRQVAGGGFIVAGRNFAGGAGGSDVWVIRLDASGGKVWEKTFGGDDDDAAFDIAVTEDGDYIVVGYGVADNYTRPYLLRMTPDGELDWEKLIVSTNWPWFVSVEATPDGGFAVAGDVYRYGYSDDVRLMKFDDMGNVEW